MACILIIINHSAGYIFEFAGKSNGTTIIYSIIFAICKMGVSLFVLSTGYLLIKNNKADNYKKIFERIFRIIIPLIGISFIIYMSVNGIKNIDIIDFLTNFIKQPQQVYLWYLYMLVGLYLVLPFIQRMIKNFKDTDYMMFIILFLIIPSLFPILSIIFKISINSYFTQATIPIFIALAALGNYLSKIELKKKYL